MLMSQPLGCHSHTVHNDPLPINHSGLPSRGCSCAGWSRAQGCAGGCSGTEGTPQVTPWWAIGRAPHHTAAISLAALQERGVPAMLTTPSQAVPHWHRGKPLTNSSHAHPTAQGPRAAPVSRCAPPTSGLCPAVTPLGDRGKTRIPTLPPRDIFHAAIARGREIGSTLRVPRLRPCRLMKAPCEGTGIKVARARWSLARRRGAWIRLRRREGGGPRRRSAARGSMSRRALRRLRGEQRGQEEPGLGELGLASGPERGGEWPQATAKARGRPGVSNRFELVRGGGAWGGSCFRGGVSGGVGACGGREVRKEG